MRIYASYVCKILVTQKNADLAACYGFHVPLDLGGVALFPAWLSMPSFMRRCLESHVTHGHFASCHLRFRADKFSDQQTCF